MAFKMKGPTFFNVGNEYEKQYPASAFQQRTGTEGQDQDKIFDDKGNHIGNWVDGKKVLFKDEKPPNDDMAYYNSLKKKLKDGTITPSEKKALDRLESQKGELEK